MKYALIRLEDDVRWCKEWMDEAETDLRQAMNAVELFGPERQQEYDEALSESQQATLRWEELTGECRRAYKAAALVMFNAQNSYISF
jgi:hypothetical protein